MLFFDGMNKISNFALCLMPYALCLMPVYFQANP